MADDVDVDGEASTESLKRDRARNAHDSDLTAEIVKREKIANDHRIQLFQYVKCIVAIAFGVVVVIVVMTGFGVLVLATPVLVAFISAMAVQSFVLIGFLARGLFMTPKAPSFARNEVE